MNVTPEERLDRIEIQIEKQNEGIKGLIVVSRTVLTSVQELRTVQGEISREMRELHQRVVAEMDERSKQTDEKLNVLIDTVDRIIRNRENGKQK